MIYIKMKMLHTLLALVSICGFTLRGCWRNSRGCSFTYYWEWWR